MYAHTFFASLPLTSHLPVGKQKKTPACDDNLHLFSYFSVFPLSLCREKNSKEIKLFLSVPLTKRKFKATWNSTKINILVPFWYFQKEKTQKELLIFLGCDFLRRDIHSSICQISLLVLFWVLQLQKRDQFKHMGALQSEWRRASSHLHPSFPLCSVGFWEDHWRSSLKLCQMLCASPISSRPCSSLCLGGTWLSSHYTVIKGTHTLINATL